MNKILNFIKARLREPSTIRGLILLSAGFLGTNLSPEQSQELTTHALALVGMFGLLPDKT